MRGGLLNETSAKQVSELMTTNYKGMVNVTQTVLPYMLSRNTGDFIVYGSVAGIVVANRFGAYGATKAVTNFYRKVLMHENRNTNIRFQLVCPPAVDTLLINQAREKGPHFLKDIQASRKNLVSPELVVDSVEKCLEKGVEINYPGPAKLVRILHPVFPNLVSRTVNKKRDSTACPISASALRSFMELALRSLANSTSFIFTYLTNIHFDRNLHYVNPVPCPAKLPNSGRN